MMPSFALLSVLVALGALFSFLSYRVLRLPTTIGTMLLSLTAASALILLSPFARRAIVGADKDDVAGAPPASVPPA